MAVKVITPPTAEPITLEQVKLNLRIVLSDDDDDLERMIRAARGMLEGITNRAIMLQTWEMATDFFPWPVVWDPRNPYGEVRLIGAPFVEVVSVKYVDGTGAQQTLDPSSYLVNDYVEPAALTPAYNSTWPVTQLRQAAVVIRYKVGYADAASVPEPLKQWLHMAVGTMYANRETNSEKQLYSLPDGFMQELIQPYMVYE